MHINHVDCSETDLSLPRQNPQVINMFFVGFRPSKNQLLKNQSWGELDVKVGGWLTTLGIQNASHHFLGLPPTKDDSYHQDYHMFCGKSQLNLHFPLFAWGCGPKQSFIKERTSKHK